MQLYANHSFRGTILCFMRDNWLCHIQAPTVPRLAGYSFTYQTLISLLPKDWIIFLYVDILIPLNKRNKLLLFQRYPRNRSIDWLSHSSLQDIPLGIHVNHSFVLQNLRNTGSRWIESWTVYVWDGRYQCKCPFCVGALGMIWCCRSH